MNRGGKAAGASSHGSPRDLSGHRSFLVTGAASGIGRALVGELATRGARVLAADLREAALAATATADGWPADRVARRAFDVRDPVGWLEAVEAACRAGDGLDVLLNVAGYLKPGGLAELTPAEIDRHLDVNVKGVMHGTVVAASAMRRAGRGHIVNVASMAALAPIPGLALYSASKFAVRAFSLAVAAECAADGVAVSVLCPDAVETPMLAVQEDHPAAALTFSGRTLTVAEVVAAVLDRILVDRPLELDLPASRGWMARLANLAPGVAARVDPLLRSRGRAAQARRKSKPA